MDLSVEVEQVLFVRDGSHQSEKVRFVIGPDGFDGWDDSTDMRRDEIAIPQGHGSFDLPGFLTPRVVALSGHAIGLNPEYLDWGGSVLTGLLGDGGSGRITVHGYGPTQWADGRKAAKTHFKVLGSNPRVAEFQVQFWCANPRKFGDPRTFAGGVPASHKGNFIAAPVLTISGDSPSGYTINGPDGKAYVVTIPLVPGHPHTIDMADGYLTVDGVIVTGAVGQADTWGIPGGAQVTMTVSAGTLSALVVDTYV